MIACGAARADFAEGEHGIVASVHPLATQAGIAAMKSGGNAVDAAVAVALTLGVVDNHNSGIGGGCFMLIRRANAAKSSRSTAARWHPPRRRGTCTFAMAKATRNSEPDRPARECRAGCARGLSAGGRESMAGRSLADLHAARPRRSRRMASRSTSSMRASSRATAEKLRGFESPKRDLFPPRWLAARAKATCSSRRTLPKSYRAIAEGRRAIGFTAEPFAKAVGGLDEGARRDS